MFPIRKTFAALREGERVSLFLASLLLIVSAAGLLGLAFAQTTRSVPQAGGTFAEGMVGQPANINPVLASGAPDVALTRLLFSNLSSLVDKIETDKTGKAWRVRLKENLRWSDGERLTADDVVFTVKKIQDPAVNSPLAGSWQGVSVERVSQIETAFTLANPYAFFSDNLQNLYLIPKHLFADVPPANWHLSDYNLKPIGSGPYVFSSYSKRPDGFITGYKLAPNPNYFKTRPFISDFEIKFFGNDADALKAFNAGQVDGLGGIDPQNLGSVHRSYDQILFDLPTYYAVFWNQSENPALTDPAVRNALYLSVNREELAKNVWGDGAEADYGPVPPSFADLPQITPTSTPLDAVNQLLDRAGWTLMGGVREKLVSKTLIPLSFKLTVPNLPFLMDTAQRLQNYWSQIGAQVEIISVEPSGALDQAVKNRDYEGLLLGNALNSGADLFSFWHSTQRFSPGLNLSLYQSRAADSLIESIRANFDPATRAAQFGRLEQVILNDNPAVFLYSPKYIYLASKSLRGLTPQMLTDSANRFLGVENWYVQTARVFK